MPLGPRRDFQHFLGRHMMATRLLADVTRPQMALRCRCHPMWIWHLEAGRWLAIDPQKLLEYIKLGFDYTAVCKLWLKQHQPE